MMDRLEFLKMLGLGVLASRVPWKWQQGTLTERAGRKKTLADISRDYIEDVEPLQFDRVFPRVAGDMVYVDFPHGRMIYGDEDEHCEVSSNGKHWWRVPKGAQITVSQESYPIYSIGSAYAEHWRGPTTYTIGTLMSMGWPNKEWSV